MSDFFMVSNRKGIKTIGVMLILVMVCIGSVAAERVGSAKGETHGDLVVMQAPPCTSFSTSDLSVVSVNDVINKLLGSGVTISNVNYVGAQNAAGTFSGGAGILGIDEGIMLSSGSIANAIGPNEYDDVSMNNALAGDADLNLQVAPFTTNDAAVLEFDFVPQTDVITFNYVFSSDEYNEWANSQYNDVFAFYVNGNNIALVPGTLTPVATNNINMGNPGTGLVNMGSPDPTPHNVIYFRNNDLQDGGGTICTEMDGLTTVLTANAIVNPGVTNHMKLAIADTSDHIYDSDVFIMGLTSPDLTLKPIDESTNNCKLSHTVTAKLTSPTGASPAGVTVTFTITSGPNAGQSGTGVTDASGEATWTYSNTGGSGTDTIVATAGQLESNKAFMAWTCNYIPEFPSILLPATFIIGFLGVVLLVHRMREH
jgi:hypothetical protein